MSFNKRVFRAETERQSNIIYQKIKPIIQEKFNDNKNQLLEEFDEHEVTQEIAAGPDASSSFVETTAGGNLFSLLGFHSHENPIEELREFLNDKIILYIQYVRKKSTPNGIAWEIPIKIPTLNDMDQGLLILEWSPSKSWVSLIEKGIPWFAHYLFDNDRPNSKHKEFSSSRSGPAIQIKNTMQRGRSYSGGIKYVSEMLNDFKQRMSR